VLRCYKGVACSVCVKFAAVKFILYQAGMVAGPGVGREKMTFHQQEVQWSVHRPLAPMSIGCLLSGGRLFCFASPGSLTALISTINIPN
jgi:hypothetical protein